MATSRPLPFTLATSLLLAALVMCGRCGAQGFSNGNSSDPSLCQQDGGTAICTQPVPTSDWQTLWAAVKPTYGGISGYVPGIDYSTGPNQALQSEIQFEKGYNNGTGNLCPSPFIQPVDTQYQDFSAGLAVHIHREGHIAEYIQTGPGPQCALQSWPTAPLYQDLMIYSSDPRRTVGCPAGYAKGGNWNDTTANAQAWCWKPAVEVPPCADACECTQAGLPQVGGGRVGDPTSPIDQVEHRHEVDIAGTGPNGLRFERWYSSAAFPYAYGPGNTQPQLPMGPNWRGSYGQHLELRANAAGLNTATVYLENGTTQVFQGASAQWLPRSDEGGRLYSNLSATGTEPLQVSRRLRVVSYAAMGNSVNC